ncbi:MAG TPA: hypothetical protein PKE20_12545, partial [Promineifilum sp.]|nr:hypothetical protein [Promineifilum sp.]
MTWATAAADYEILADETENPEAMGEMAIELSAISSGFLQWDAGTINVSVSKKVGTDEYYVVAFLDIEFIGGAWWM